jgi:hypothetical protein
MFGPPTPRRLDEPITGSLAEHIPHDHFDRHLKMRRNLRFVGEWVTEHDAERDRPRIDPTMCASRRLMLVPS